MTQLTIAPVQWSRLKNIEDVDPLNNDDTDCLAEIRDVLKRHGKLDRWGVALLHSHFDLDSDEILVETGNEESRILTITPVKLSDADANNVGTIWKLSDGDITSMAWCRQYCRRDWLVGHYQAHDKVK